MASPWTICDWLPRLGQALKNRRRTMVNAQAFVQTNLERRYDGVDLGSVVKRTWSLLQNEGSTADVGNVREDEGQRGLWHVFQGIAGFLFCLHSTIAAPGAFCTPESNSGRAKWTLFLGLLVARRGGVCVPCVALLDHSGTSHQRAARSTTRYSIDARKEKEWVPRRDQQCGRNIAPRTDVVARDAG